MSSSSAAARRREDNRMHTAEMPALTENDLDGTVPPPPPVPPLGFAPTAALVAAGGALGTLGRWVLSESMPVVLTSTLVAVPWPTVLANLLGCLLLGVLNGVLDVRPRSPRWLTPFLGVGVAGGFTTFSTVIFHGAAMIGANAPVLALVYATLTLVAGLGGVLLGFIAGRRFGAPGEHGGTESLGRPRRPRGGAGPSAAQPAASELLRREDDA